LESNHHQETEFITLGAGCFWCIEAIYQQVDGVLDVESGYAGGDSSDPTYKTVKSGKHGHTEVVKVTFDREKISLEEILKIFFYIHDPTALRKQGKEVKTQYISAIFYNDERQRKKAEEIKNRVEEIKNLKEGALVTKIALLKNYKAAEAEHQNFYQNDPSNSYCQTIIKPKLEEFSRMVDEVKAKK